MAKKSQSAKKKNRISKHVLNGRQQQAESSTEKGDNDATSALTTTDKAPQQPSVASRKDRQIKDPEEAAAYLHNWKASKKGSSSSATWKFNKNTQSWLIRHMYEVDKVPKNEFSVLMEYLEGLQGDVTKSRIVADATRRAKRYKEHAKKMEEEKEAEADKDSDDDDDDDENEQKNAEDNASKKKKGTKKDSSLTKEEMEYEEKRWKKLSEHDKRKEYKRARKVLDLIKL